MAVRAYMHDYKTKSAPVGYVDEILAQASISSSTAYNIWYLTAMASLEDRFVIPPMYREIGIEMMKDDNPFKDRSESGFGFRQVPERYW